MRRREFISAFVGAVVAWPLSVYAQPRVPRVGILLTSRVLSPTDLPIARELARIGYVEGRNITYLVRSAEGDASRLPLLARELVVAKPDVIVAAASPAAVALFHATNDSPIVMTVVGDPISLGLTSSISHPTHNVTGFTGTPLLAKRLEILHDIVPSVKKAAYLWMLESPITPLAQSQVRRAADALGIKLVSLPLKSDADIDAAFARAEKEQVTAILVDTSPLTVRFSSSIVDRCLFYNISCMHTYPFEAHNGALISYGPATIENNSGAAEYIDRILKGAKVADLPFQEPKDFKLVVNLRTARSLGIVVPPTALIRADEVIE
jgi:putative ABC transport system substrate-binding protein